MRVIALMCSYNEHRFIDACLRHLTNHGIEAYLIDNCSTDNTVDLAERWVGRGLIGIESFPRGKADSYNWRALLARKEELAGELDADWFLHLDPDEFRLAPARGQTLCQALEMVDGEGFTAVNFVEYTFMPTQEQPDHDHGRFLQTLCTYYPFSPVSAPFPHQLKAWRATDGIELTWSAGHKVRYPGMKIYPSSFPMKHYLCLSVPHAIEKYVDRRYDRNEIRMGWHRWRSRLTPLDVALPKESELNVLPDPDAELEWRSPRSKHYLAEMMDGSAAAPERAGRRRRRVFRA